RCGLPSRWNLQQPSRYEARQEQSGNGSCGRKARPFSEYLTNQSPTLRTERDAHAELAAALTRGVDHCAVETETAQQDGHRCRRTDEDHGNALGCERDAAQMLFERRDHDR